MLESELLFAIMLISNNLQYLMNIYHYDISKNIKDADYDGCNEGLD